MVTEYRHPTYPDWQVPRPVHCRGSFLQQSAQSPPSPKGHLAACSLVSKEVTDEHTVYTCNNICGYCTAGMVSPAKVSHLVFQNQQKQKSDACFSLKKKTDVVYRL